MEMHPLFQQTELDDILVSQKAPHGIWLWGLLIDQLGTIIEHRSDLEDPIINEIAKELGITPGQVCLSWAIQRENRSGGFVVMSTRSKYIRENLECTIQDLLKEQHLKRINGDGTESNPGLDVNNRLIWGQVFLWPEADGDWRVLWNDSQVFETRENYIKFKKSWNEFMKIKMETTYQVK
jgi:diketogulonate reductase-like aldo/keto reductase